MSGQQKKDIVDILTALFGAPDQLRLSALEAAAISDVLDADRLAMAAGPAGNDEAGRPFGLYRKHCAHCHGVTGGGAGPAATFMDPYPRDFRPGTFKFKSTPRGQKPTDKDLQVIIKDGIPGTSMPSYSLLSDEGLESTVHYVKYLSIRGEVERALIYESAGELEEGDRLVDPPLGSGGHIDLTAEQFGVVRELAADVVNKWRDAPSLITAVPTRTDGWDSDESAARGRELFHGPMAGCTKCHGDLGRGDGQTNDYDDWTKEIDPTSPSVAREHLALGALPPRNIRPRNLRQGVYRGGRRPEDLFLRLKNGIDGTPMPAVLWKPDDARAEQKGLTTRDIWALICYVRSLPYEPISQTTTKQ
jgi:mono/diheme cytochrome c family protein